MERRLADKALKIKGENVKNVFALYNTYKSYYIIDAEIASKILSWQPPQPVEHFVIF